MTSMTMTTDNLDSYYTAVQKSGKLRSPVHAQRWSQGILRTLGINLDRGTKKKLAQALPSDLAADLTRVFWLAHFRNSGMSQHEFLNQISRRSGNTDPSFARYPTTAVFHQLKTFAGQELSDQVAQALSPGVRQMWQEA